MSGSTASLPEQDSSGERERLGRFTLLAVIGRGASATVYEALDTRMERAVALKVLSFDPLLSPEQRQRQIERFEREARAVARLSHPNIVSVYDVGEEDGKYFLVMELLSGVTLRERLDQGGPIALGEATSILEQIASALDCTHAEGIVHRDIKPSNVLLLPDGRVKMLDFGIARRGEDATVTHAGMLIGSPAYMSPEQGRGENASAASDIWALGALLYEMLTGQSPFGATNVAAVLYKAAYDKPEPLPDDVSLAQKVIDHALAKQPEERYATAGAMASALRSAVESPFRSVPLNLPPRSGIPAKGSSLQSVAGSGFVASSAKSVTDEPSPVSPTEGTAKNLSRSRSRFADIAVIAAWGSVVAAALGIVTVRMRQSSTPPATVLGTKGSAAASGGAATVTTAPAPVVAVPTAAPSPASPTFAPPVPPVQIVERKLAAPAAKTVVVLPSAKPSALPPSPSVITKATPRKAAVIATPRSTPVVPAKPLPEKTAAPSSPSKEPPWDERVDRLGDPEPEPTPDKTSAPERPQQTPDDTPESSAEKPRFKSSVLLGRWKGNIWKRNATLDVKASDGESFQGTLTLRTEKGTLLFPIEGSFSPVTGRVSFWSTADPAEATEAKIDLGQESGRLISSKTMGGMGIDSNRRVFTWSFSR